MTFLNRADAGRQLADTLRRRHSMDTFVVGVTRGGVPVAADLARSLGAPLDICVVRKLLVRRDQPITIGAVAEGGATYFDPQRLARFAVSSRELGDAIGRESAEVKRLAGLLRDGKPQDLRGRDVIVVDDGVLTGFTMRCAALALTARGVHALELATPVGMSQVIDELRPDFDHVTCLESDPYLVSVGTRYQDFWPVSDAQIIDLLEMVALELTAVAVV
jgi:putative phosphoribosyl transferase